MIDEDIRYQAEKAVSFCRRNHCPFEMWSVNKEFTDREFIKIKDKYEELINKSRPYRDNKLNKILRSLSTNMGKNNE